MKKTIHLTATEFVKIEDFTCKNITELNLSKFCKKAVMFFDIDPIQIGKYTSYEVILLAKKKSEWEIRLFDDNITLMRYTENFCTAKEIAESFKDIKRRKEEIKENKLSGWALKAMAVKQWIIICLITFFWLKMCKKSHNPPKKCDLF